MIWSEIWKARWFHVFIFLLVIYLGNFLEGFLVTICYFHYWQLVKSKCSQEWEDNFLSNVHQFWPRKFLETTQDHYISRLKRGNMMLNVKCLEENLHPICIHSNLHTDNIGSSFLGFFRTTLFYSTKPYPFTLIK